MLLRILAFLLLFCSVASAQTVDKKFLVAQGAVFGAAALDAYTTTRCLARPGFSEANPLLGAHPSPAHVYAFTFGISAATGFLSYELKKHHHKLWLMEPIAGTAAHAFAAGWNAHLCN